MLIILSILVMLCIPVTIPGFIGFFFGGVAGVLVAYVSLIALAAIVS
jgi:hypothetical protein